MSCPREEDLALHVEGDLPGRAADDLERHLQVCSACQGFLADLRESQGRLKLLGEEPLDDRALAEVRARVRAALAPSAARRQAPPVWRWAVAAGLLFSALGAMYVWKIRSVDPRRPSGVAEATPPSARTLTRPAAAPTGAVLPGTPSTIGQAPRVSPGMRSARPPSSTALSPEEADQLARAIVAVSRVERLSDAVLSAPDRVATAPLVRWVTDDPSVVIYWQIDSNGG